MILSKINTILILLLSFFISPITWADASLCSSVYPNTSFALDDVKAYSMEVGVPAAQLIDAPVKDKSGVEYWGWQFRKDPDPNSWVEAVCYYKGTPKTLRVKIPKEFAFCGIPNTEKPLMEFKCFKWGEVSD
jgi:hypothetical protein